MGRDLGKDLARAGGLTTREALTALGHSEHSLRLATKTGRATIPRRGWIGCAAAAPEAMRAVQLGGRLGGRSALQSYGIWVDDGPLVDSCSPSASRLPELRTGEVRTRRRTKFAESGATPWRVSVRDALLQLSTMVDRSSLIASLDSALYTRKLHPTQLAGLIAALPERLRSVRHEIDARAMSGTETKLRLACVAAGMRVQIQVSIPSIGIVDLLIDDWLIVEVDSKKHHDEPIQQHKDRVRDGSAVLGRLGHERFDYALIQYELPWCVEVILARLAEGRPNVST